MDASSLKTSKVGRGSKHPDRIKGDPVHCRGRGLDGLESPFQPKLIHNSLIIKAIEHAEKVERSRVLGGAGAEHGPAVPGGARGMLGERLRHTLLTAPCHCKAVSLLGETGKCVLCFVK